MVTRRELLALAGGGALAGPIAKALIEASDAASNIMLTGGEEIRVPEAGRLFVVGNVKKPGSFSVRDDSEATVLKALAVSEGLLPFASTQAFIYRREGGAGGGKNDEAGRNYEWAGRTRRPI